MAIYTAVPTVPVVSTRQGAVAFGGPKDRGVFSVSIGNAITHGLRSETRSMRAVAGWQLHHDLILSQIAHGGRVFRFSQPLRCEVGEQDGYPAVRCPAIGCVVMSRTADGLQAALGDELAFLWDTYVEASDGVLSPDARILKQRLRALVTCVTEVTEP